MEKNEINKKQETLDMMTSIAVNDGGYDRASCYSLIAVAKFMGSIAIDIKEIRDLLEQSKTK